MVPLIIRGLHHDHIDGSAALMFIIDELYKMANKPFRFDSITNWVTFMRSPIDIPTRFSTITKVLQSEEALELLGLTYGRYRAHEGFRYVEAKFAPQYHVEGGLTMRQATWAMLKGLRKAEQERPIRIFPHLCIGREADENVGREVARIALEYEGEVALGLACNEALYPPEKHLPAFKLTFGSNVKRDCHAGEFAKGALGSPERQDQLVKNIVTAIRDLRCHGIGHAIPLASYPELVKEVVDKNVRVAGCPLSNRSEGNILHVEDLGIQNLLDAGVVYTLNADDDLFLPPMHEVVQACERTYQFTDAQKRALEDNVLKGAWMNSVF